VTVFYPEYMRITVNVVEFQFDFFSQDFFNKTASYFHSQQRILAVTCF